MPGSLLSLQLTDTYRGRLIYIRDRLKATGEETFPPADSPEGFEWADRMAAAVAQAQAQAVRASAAYLTAFLSSELGRPVQGPVLDPTPYVGVTRNGRRVAEQLRTPMLNVRKAWAEGADPNEARRKAVLQARLMLDDDVMYAGRESLAAGMVADERITSWHRALEGTCDQCVGATDYEQGVLPGMQLFIHPNCVCVAEPEVEGSDDDRYKRQTGSEHFNSLSKAEQDELLGIDRAEACRRGLAKPADFFDEFSGRMKAVDEVLDADDLDDLARYVARRKAALKGWETRRTKWELYDPDDLAHAAIDLDTIEYQGGGISKTFTAYLDDGVTKVQIKTPLDWPGIREAIDETLGLEHQQAASRIAHFFGLNTPTSVVRRVDDLGDDFVAALERAADDAYETIDTDFLSRVGLTQWVDDVTTKVGDRYVVARDQAERQNLFDLIIGNADRHHGQWGTDSLGNLWSLDHDLCFPTGPVDDFGNTVFWTNRYGEAAFDGQPFSRELAGLLDDFLKNETKWRQVLRQDGLTFDEIDSLVDRVRELKRKGRHLSYQRLLSGGSPWKTWPGSVG